MGFGIKNCLILLFWMHLWKKRNQLAEDIIQNECEPKYSCKFKESIHMYSTWDGVASIQKADFFSDAYISKIYHNLILIFVLSFKVEMQLADLGNYSESSVTDKSSKITYKVLNCMPCNFSWLAQLIRRFNRQRTFWVDDFPSRVINTQMLT